MREIAALLPFAVSLAERAGAILGEHRTRGVHASVKADGRELVTAADLAVDAIVHEAFARETPGVQVLSEERATSVDPRKPTWVVDPIDGTANFALGQAHVGISLALAIDGVVELGVVHAPFTRETFAAVRGRGATWNGETLPRDVARASRLADAVVATGFPHDRKDLDRILQRFGRVVRRARDVRRLAAPTLDLCWVAMGRLDAAYETLRPWDVAAAGLVAEECGVARDHYGPRLERLPPALAGEDVVFAGPDLLAELLAVLRAED